MSKSTKGLRNAGLASLAITLTLGAGALGAGAANAVEGFTLDRIGGEDRYETSALIADEYNETNPDVILTNGEPGSYADALTANYLAGELDVPILLTRENRTPDFILDQLKEDETKNITVVGGAGVVSEEQVEALEAEGYNVERISGSDRFLTNAEVIEAGGAATDGVGVIATGFNFPDALAAGPISYQGHPLGLSTQNDIDDEVIAALKGAGVDTVVIMGGTAAVGQAVVTKLANNGITVEERFSGSDRSDTSEKAAEWALENLGFTDEHLNIASGYTQGYGADALAGGPLTGMQDRPLLITKDVNNPDDVLDYINAHDDTLIDGIIFGGPAAVSVAAEAAMEAAGQGDAPASNQDYAVTGSEKAVNTVSEGTSTNANRGARTYSVSGLDSTKTYDIELHEAEDVVTDANDNVTFKNNTPAASGGSIESVNGAVVGTAGSLTETREVHNVTPINGEITFTVDSDEADRIIPVVNGDADGDNTLDLETGATNTTPKAPTEEFGIGGEKEWIPNEATAAAFTAAADDLTIVRVNKDANYVLVDTDDADTVANFTVYYDSNDQFRLASGTVVTGNAGDTQNCNPVSMTTWENNLSTGDELDLNSIYAADEEASSTLCLEDLTPTAVGGVDASAVDEDTIEVVWGAPGTAPNSFNVYRKTGGETPTLTDYTKVGTVSGSTLKYTDNGLNAATEYAYAVTQVVDGDESPIDANSADAATTTAAGATAQPQSTDAYLQTDSTFQGELSDGDVFRVIFDKQMAPIAENDIIRLRDAEGEVTDFICSADTTLTGQNGQCQFNANDVTIAGTTYAAGRVLTVTASGAFVDTATGGSNRYEYPLTIVNQSGITDAANRAWTPSDDPDNVVDDEGTKTSAGNFTTATAPAATDAGYVEATTASAGTTFGDEAGDRVTVTFDNPINVVDGTTTVTVDWDGSGVTAAALVTYTCVAAPTAATEVSCSGTGTPTLTLTSIAANVDQAVLLGNAATDSKVTGSNATGYYGGTVVDATSFPEDIDA